MGCICWSQMQGAYVGSLRRMILFLLHLKGMSLGYIRKVKNAENHCVMAT